jgi:hypothetical protein
MLSGGKTDYVPAHWTSHLEGVTNVLASLNADAKVVFAEGCDIACSSSAMFQAATAAAAQADATLAFVGIDHTIEHEGGDRTTIGLVGQQEELLRALSQAAKGPLIVVFVHGGPLSSSWAKENADVVLDAIDGGEAAGTALAQVLFGQVSPSGLLPYTILPESYAQENDFLNMSMRAAPGRTYRFYTGQPLWPFGFGLTYSTFSYAWARQPPQGLEIVEGAVARFALSVTNTGVVSSGLPVQAYLQEITPRSQLHAFDSAALADVAPAKTLVGLQKIRLAPGEQMEVIFEFAAVPASHSEWCSFCTVSAGGYRLVAPGQYRLHFGGHGGADAAPLAAELELHGDARPLPL